MASAKLVCALLLCIVLSAPMLNVDALSCGVVAGDLAQCLTYLKKGGRVPLACCKGVKALKNAAKTTQDRRDACNCLKQTASKVGGVNAGFAAALPRICGVNIPYKFSTSTNCASFLLFTLYYLKSEQYSLTTNVAYDSCVLASSEVDS
ncbi:hypothetical protein POTOM_023117 [Populus tomentosa]|uniref:Bifunctional inhibitor/plant lipid transfer protein/seed storage helical domain-containing protein n=1 Tax=Populus tomentosa TaxID=118781 RepID=A0A8X7ZZ47_POPTO|nr:hypothetical protein POTOM_023117 [Populus tomentosa]